MNLKRVTSFGCLKEPNNLLVSLPFRPIERSFSLGVFRIYVRFGRQQGIDNFLVATLHRPMQRCAATSIFCIDWHANIHQQLDDGQIAISDRAVKSGFAARIGGLHIDAFLDERTRFVGRNQDILLAALQRDAAREPALAGN